MLVLPQQVFVIIRRGTAAADLGVEPRGGHTEVERELSHELLVAAGVALPVEWGGLVSYIDVPQWPRRCVRAFGHDGG